MIMTRAAIWPPLIVHNIYDKYKYCKTFGLYNYFTVRKSHQNFKLSSRVPNVHNVACIVKKLLNIIHRWSTDGFSFQFIIYFIFIFFIFLKAK